MQDKNQRLILILISTPTLMVTLKVIPTESPIPVSTVNAISPPDRVWNVTYTFMPSLTSKHNCSSAGTAVNPLAHRWGGGGMREGMRAGLKKGLALWQGLLVYSVL